MVEFQTKSDEQARQLADFGSQKTRMMSDSSETNRQLEDAESRLNALHRTKTQLSSQLEESKRSLEDESRVSLRAVAHKFGTATIKIACHSGQNL